MSYIYILTNNVRIKNTEENTYTIMLEEVPGLEASRLIKEHTYKLQCGGAEFYMHSLEMQNQTITKKNSYLILPKFLIPKRPYPAYVYIHAIALYSMNPQMSQREATRRTRKRFGLATFSHTTLGRAIKRLEKVIKDKTTEAQNEEKSTEPAEKEDRKSFPTVAQTKDRRKYIAKYLKKAADGSEVIKQETMCQKSHAKYKTPPYSGEFVKTCNRIIEYTFSMYNCLLL
jgi:hypothetical protein